MTCITFYLSKSFWIDSRVHVFFCLSSLVGFVRRDIANHRGSISRTNFSSCLVVACCFPLHVDSLVLNSYLAVFGSGSRSVGGRLVGVLCVVIGVLVVAFFGVGRRSAIVDVCWRC